MLSIRTHRYTDPPALSLALGGMRRGGLTPRGVLFLALEPDGAATVAAAEHPDEVASIRVGDKLSLAFPLAGRFYHFDSIHRLGGGQFLYNGDRRLHQAGNAVDVAGAMTEFLHGADARSVFFGCTPHQPGSWVAARHGTIPLHQAGFVEAVPVGDGLLARRIMDHRLWLVSLGQRLDDWRPVFESPLGNVMLMERRLAQGRLVLTCERGLVEVDVSRLPAVTERERAMVEPGVAVVGRVGETAFAVTRGQPRPWGLDEIAPAVLVGATGGTLAALEAALAAGAGETEG